jgi:hypothetical protein
MNANAEAPKTMPTNGAALLFFGVADRVGGGGKGFPERALLLNPRVMALCCLTSCHLFTLVARTSVWKKAARRPFCVEPVARKEPIGARFSEPSVQNSWLKLRIGRDGGRIMNNLLQETRKAHRY